MKSSQKKISFLLAVCLAFTGAPASLHANESRRAAWWNTIKHYPVASLCLGIPVGALLYKVWTAFASEAEKPAERPSIPATVQATKPGVFERKIYANNYPLPPACQEAQNTITIWIHGTKALSFAGDYVHAAPKSGLIPISELSEWYRLKGLMTLLHQMDPHYFPMEHMYVFGWSGLLGFEHRKKDAKILYDSLKKLVAEHKEKHGVEPLITLITHSHGGNVALNLAHVKEADITMRIRAILLACPVQHETKECVKDNLFERVYSYYSPADWLQVLDPQGLYLTENNEERHLELSERKFPHQPNLRQAQVMIDGEHLYHLGFIRQRFVKILPLLLRETENWEQEMPSNNEQERIFHITGIE